MAHSFIETFRELSCLHRYLFDFEIGTPAKTASLIVDTGSYNIWFQSLDSPTCLSQEVFCENYTTYSINQSSSAQLVTKEAFNITFVDGPLILDEYLEKVSFANVTLSNLTIGLAEQPFNVSNVANVGQGVLGLGPSGGVTYGDGEGPRTNPGFLQSLQQYGYVQSQAFSMYLEDDGEFVTASLSVSEPFKMAGCSNLPLDTGTIIFGGVDQAKLGGPLRVLPLLKEVDDNALTYASNLTTLSLASKGKSAVNLSISSGPYLAWDTGATATYLPLPAAEALYDQLGVGSDISQGPIVDCKEQSSSDQLVFTVPIAQSTTYSFNISISSLISTQNGSCILGVYPQQASNHFVWLGDNALRSLYVVYDGGNSQIAVAPLKRGVSNSQIVSISPGVIPGISNA